jgi:DUF4097 and DUF4098 domain-containing protein YvlB
MKLRLLAAGAFLVFAAPAFAAPQPDGNFDRTLNVSAQPDLYVSTGSGTIRIGPGTDGQIHIVGHVHAGWNAFGDVNARIQSILANPPITQSGNAIHVGESNDHSLFNNISIDYEITVPAAVALNLRTGSGDVEVDNVGRYLSGTTGSGAVRAHGLHGPAVLETGSGDIEVEEQAAGDIRAKTGSGSIRIHGLNGGFQAKTGSGDIEADGNLTGAANLSSGSGSVRLHIAPSTHFTLEATTGSGDIRCSFPGAPQQDDRNRHHMTASINGGGPVIEAHTGSGDIDITPH